MSESAARCVFVAIILSAGLSRRMGAWNKLLLRDARGRSVIARTVDAVLGSRVGQTIVVVGPGSAIPEELGFRAVSCVEAPDHEEGLAASLRAGLAAVPETTEAILVCLGDMPLVRSETLDSILDALDPAAGRLIVVPRFQGQRGNPVLWHRSLLPDLLSLSGDTGGRLLLDRHKEAVTILDTSDPGVLADLDTPEDAEALSLVP